MQSRKILDIISRSAGSDPHLAGLYDRAKEYAQVYLFAKRRQKGCDGLGEITGALSADDLLGLIFGRFCIGK